MVLMVLVMVLLLLLHIIIVLLVVHQITVHVNAAATADAAAQNTDVRWHTGRWQRSRRYGIQITVDAAQTPRQTGTTLKMTATAAQTCERIQNCVCWFRSFCSFFVCCFVGSNNS